MVSKWVPTFEKTTIGAFVLVGKSYSFVIHSLFIRYSFFINSLFVFYSCLIHSLFIVYSFVIHSLFIQCQMRVNYTKGTQFGTMISFPLSGWLCDLDADGGWPLAFYVPGVVGILWLVAWIFLVYNNPQEHPRIKEDEKLYILASTGITKQRSVNHK